MRGCPGTPLITGGDDERRARSRPCPGTGRRAGPSMLLSRVDPEQSDIEGVRARPPVDRLELRARSTGHEFDFADPVYSPDGSKLAFVTYYSPGEGSYQELVIGRSDALAQPCFGGVPRAGRRGAVRWAGLVAGRHQARRRALGQRLRGGRSGRPRSRCSTCPPGRPARGCCRPCPIRRRRRASSAVRTTGTRPGRRTGPRWRSPGSADCDRDSVRDPGPSDSPSPPDTGRVRARPDVQPAAQRHRAAPAARAKTAAPPSRPAGGGRAEFEDAFSRHIWTVRADSPGTVPGGPIRRQCTGGGGGVGGPAARPAAVLDQRPAWDPAGTGIAFTRRTEPSTPAATHPDAILLVRAATGAAAGGAAGR